MISAAEAVDRIRERVRPLSAVTLGIEQALGRTLAEDIVAAENIPPFDNSAMDGYALRSEDTAGAHVSLKVIGEIAAGPASSMAIGKGEAVAIMTGAKIPAGADAVLQHELTERESPDAVRIMKSVVAGTNIRRAGADIARGRTVFTAGHRLRPQELGVLASMGRQFVSVHRAPLTAILSTGSELVPIDRTPGDGMIRNSNAYAIAALLREQGADVHNLGIARDEREELRKKLEHGLKADVLITIGGVSAGAYDLVIRELTELGVEQVFWKVNIKPGMPLYFGMKDETAVFGLPGNPVSSMVTALQFVRPALHAMAGWAGPTFSTVRARLLERVTKNDGKRHFVRGIVEMREGTPMVRQAGSQVSNVMTSLARANCLIIIPEETAAIEKGEEVDVELL